MSKTSTERLTKVNVRECMTRSGTLQLNASGNLSARNPAKDDDTPEHVSCDAGNGKHPSSMALKLDFCQGGDRNAVVVFNQAKVCAADTSCAMALALNTTEVLNVKTIRSGMVTSGDTNTKERRSDGGQHVGGSLVPGSHKHGQVN